MVHLTFWVNQSNTVSIGYATLHARNHHLSGRNHLFHYGLWVISSGKMVISYISVCLHMLSRATFDHQKILVSERNMMNHEESMMPSGYEASPAEVQTLVMEWVKATEAFHQRYAKLTKVINELQKTARRQPATNRARLRRLVDLRQHMSDVLMTLLLDMSGQRQSRSNQPSKPGQLRSHAYLLDELNREIDTELSHFSVVAQA